MIIIWKLIIYRFNIHIYLIKIHIDNWNDLEYNSFKLKTVTRKSKYYAVLRERNSSAVKFLEQAILKTTSELITELK